MPRQLLDNRNSKLKWMIFRHSDCNIHNSKVNHHHSDYNYIENSSSQIYLILSSKLL